MAPARTETQIYDQLQEALDRARCWYRDVITDQRAVQDFSRLRDVVLCTVDRDHKLGLWQQPDDDVATLSQAQLATIARAAAAFLAIWRLSPTAAQRLASDDASHLDRFDPDFAGDLADALRAARPLLDE